MFSYSTPKEGGYAVLTPKFEQNDVRQIHFNGIRITENDTYFDIYTCCTSAKRVAQYSETDRKYLDFEVPSNEIVRIRLIKKEHEVYKRKKTPTEFDEFFVRYIKELCNDKGEALVYGKLDMSSAMSSFIERVNAADNIESVAHFYNELIETKSLDKLPDELSSFKLPEAKEPGTKSSYGGRSYSQKEGERLEERVNIVKELLDTTNGDNDLWARSLIIAGHQMTLSPDDPHYDNGLYHVASNIHLDLVKAILSK